MEKAKAAADLITNVTGSKDVTIKHLDLASLKSVRSFAEDINKNENKLDILINNAGKYYTIIDLMRSTHDYSVYTDLIND